MNFHKLPQVCLAKAHVTTLDKKTQYSFLKSQPPLQKLRYTSLTKTLVLEKLQQIVFQST
jgi:hypothetical protein